MRRRRAPARPPAGGGPAEMGHALESLRVASTLFVVLYHAALSYVATPLRLTLWVAFDSPGHVGFDAFVYWVNGFVMPVFFLAAGVSAPASCESRGPRTFLIHRAQRLLRPLLFGCIAILPAFYLLWGYGLMVTGRLDLDHILSWRYPPPIDRDVYGLGHLWFLEYLFLRLRRSGAFGWMARNRTIAAKKPPGDAGRRIEALFELALVPAGPRRRRRRLDLPGRLRHHAPGRQPGRAERRSTAPLPGLLRRRGLDGEGQASPERTFSRFGPIVPGARPSSPSRRCGRFLIRHAVSPLDGVGAGRPLPPGGDVPVADGVFGGLGTCPRGSGRGKGPIMRFLWRRRRSGSYLVHVPIVALRPARR